MVLKFKHLIPLSLQKSKPYDQFLLLITILETCHTPTPPADVAVTGTAYFLTLYTNLSEKNPTVLVLKGSSPASNSCAMVSPSPSGSVCISLGSSGSNPYRCSSPSLIPSPSESSLNGSVPSNNSSHVGIPSPSGSCRPSGIYS